MTLRYLIEKEIIQIRRNAFLPRLILVFPIVVMCVLPWVMNQEVKNVKVDVVDNDRSALSQRLVHRIEASGYFHFNGQKATYAEALKEIERSEADIAVVIPRGYGKQTANTQIVTATARADLSALQQQVSTLNLYNKHQSYKVYMIPALLAIVLMLMCGFLPALNIVGEKEAGTIEQINVTPVSKWAFILAKLIPYWVIALFIITVCLLLSWAVYGITCQGPLWLVYVLALLLALFFSSFGLLVSNFSDTMQQAIFVMWFFVVILMLLSGLFTPTRSMPTWAYTTTYVNPMHYFIDAIRTIFIRGGGFSSIAHQVAALGGIALIMAVLAVRSYKKNA